MSEEKLPTAFATPDGHVIDLERLYLAMIANGAPIQNRQYVLDTVPYLYDWLIREQKQQKKQEPAGNASCSIM